MIEPICYRERSAEWTSSTWRPSPPWRSMAASPGLPAHATVQSNVTGRLKRLEAELGARLFERHSRGVALTTAGQRLLPYAERIQALLGRHAGPRPMTAPRAARSASAPWKRRQRCACHRCSSLIRAPARRWSWSWAPAPLRRWCRTCLNTGRRRPGGRSRGHIPSWTRRQPSRRNWCWSRRRGLRGPDALARAGELKVLVFRAGCPTATPGAILAAQGISGARRLEFGTSTASWARPPSQGGRDLAAPGRGRAGLARGPGSLAYPASGRGKGHDGAGPPPRRLCLQRA